MVGRDTIDIGHQHVCILTAIDRANNIYIEPVSAGTATAKDVYSRFTDRISKEAIIITDGHRSYRDYIKKEKISHVTVNGGTYVNGAFSLSRVNGLHSSMERFFQCHEYKPATKYLDLYLMMFWWLQKNKEQSLNTLGSQLYDIMTGHIDYEARAKMTKVRIKDLVSRELPIDTKGFYPQVA